MMRRDLIALLGGAAVAWPLAARAQQKAVPVIGLLSPGSPPPSDIAALHQGLSETGYVEGQNLAMEYRRAEGQYDRLPAMAADLVNRKVDLIVAIAQASLAASRPRTSLPLRSRPAWSARRPLTRPLPGELLHSKTRMGRSPLKIRSDIARWDVPPDSRIWLTL